MTQKYNTRARMRAIDALAKRKRLPDTGSLFNGQNSNAQGQHVWWHSQRAQSRSQNNQ